MAYKQAGGVLGDPVKVRVASGGGGEKPTSQVDETVESVDRTGTNQRSTGVPMEKRAKGSGAVYSKERKATKSTTGTIDGPVAFRYKSGGKIWNYVPGAQNNNPTTGIRL